MTNILQHDADGSPAGGTETVPRAEPESLSLAPVPMAPPEKSEGAGKLARAAAQRHRELSELLARPPENVKDADFVHDVRVAARRLGEVARILAGPKTLLEKSSAKAVNASLRSLRRSMGDLRDADVTRAHLLKWRMPAPVKKVAREVAEQLEEARAKMEKAAREQMTSASVSGAMVVLARILEQHGTPQGASGMQRELQVELAGQLKKREKQMRRCFGKAMRKQTAAALHEARIAVKKLRYAMELAQDAGTEKDAKKKVRFLKGLQALLGDHHDVHVILEQVQKHLKDRREKPLKGLAAAWKKWHAEMERGQAKRAAEFFAASYRWINHEP